MTPRWQWCSGWVACKVMFLSMHHSHSSFVSWFNSGDTAPPNLLCMSGLLCCPSLDGYICSSFPGQSIWQLALLLKALGSLCVGVSQSLTKVLQFWCPDTGRPNLCLRHLYLSPNLGFVSEGTVHSNQSGSVATIVIRLVPQLLVVLGWNNSDSQFREHFWDRVESSCKTVLLGGWPGLHGSICITDGIGLVHMGTLCPEVS